VEGGPYKHLADKGLIGWWGGLTWTRLSFEFDFC